jgi:Carboxypeptidase regulatory-like domain/TonB-dependent Receptor Plug Domain
MKSNFWGRSLGVAALLLLVAGGAAFAQLQSGNLYATVTDEQGGALPGVTVTISGNGAPQVQVTNAQGETRFLGLSPGSYSLEAQLEGFSTLNYPNIVINVGRNTSIELTLSAAVEDVITVTAESPLLDPRKVTFGNTVDSTELEKIPTARDPWAILQSTPGVLTDRINVGGNESGQQSNYTGRGSSGTQAVWSLDGVVITDMSATGSSPGYYDFDAFEEMQVSTGGSDATAATGGVTLNMVTKRGTNEWRGSGRYYESNKSNQSDLDLDSSELGRRGPWNNNTAQAVLRQGNRIVKVEDYGAELGGPIVKDRLWIWGSYSKPEIALRTIGTAAIPDGFSDVTTLEDWNAKLNAQLTASNSATAFGWNSDKVKIGRNAGPTRPQETTWNQGKFGPSPTALKVEDTHVFSSNFYLTGMYSKVNGGFQLAPQGGDRVPFLDINGIWRNSFFLIQIERPQEQFKADASSFFNTGTLSHELKYGASFRTAEQTTLSRTQGGGYEIQLSPTTSFYGVARDQFVGVEAEYTSIYLQDTFSVGNLTANLGVRYDKQGGDNVAKTVGANRLFPDLLPAINYAGQPGGFEWETIVPRLGLTYALGAERKTLLRLSYSQFADQLGTGFVSWLNPIAAQSYAYFYGPVRGNGVLPTRAELGAPAYFSANVNPNTGQLLQSNQVDSDLNAPISSELAFGIEHALRPEFVVGLSATFRENTDLLEQERLVFDCGGTARGCATSNANLNNTGRVHRRSDYRQRPGTAGVLSGTRPDGSTYSLPIYELVPGVDSRNGFLLENGDREQDYKGFSLTFTKRLANRWMLRGNVSWQDWTNVNPDSENEDPQEQLAGANGSALKDGDIVLQGSGTGSGAKGNVYINSEWSYSINGLYQVAPDRPWGFNVAANVTGRQGYPAYYFRRFTTSPRTGIPEGGISIPVVNNSDDYRYDDIQVVDLRVEKEFNIKDFGFTVGADVFNATNEATVLQRQGRLNIGTGDHITETISPRIIRLGVKLNFR